MKHPLFLLFALVIALPTTRAGEPLEDLPKQIGILVEYYEIEHAALPPLMRDYLVAPDASAFRKTVEEMAVKGAARMVESSYIVTRSGQRAKIESIREILYPTEYNPQEIHSPTGQTEGYTLPAAPVAFEMRPVGATVESEPIAQPDGATIQLSLAAELVTLQAFVHHGEGLAKTTHPIFASMKASQRFKMKGGDCELFGVFTPDASHDRNGEGKRVLGFVSPLLLSAISLSDLAEFGKNPPSAPVETVENVADVDPFNEPPAEDEAAGPFPPEGEVRMFTEYIEVDAPFGARLIRELGECSDATAIRHALDKVIAKGEAKVLESASLQTSSGQRTKSEAIREYIYPTEQDRPAGIPQDFAGAKFAPTYIGSAFEMRPLGITVEAEPHVGSNGKMIEINVAPEQVRHVRNLAHGQGAAACRQPLFETLQLQTFLPMPDGTITLLGMHSLETARAGEAGTDEERAAVRGRRVLVFVTAKVKKVE